MTQIPQTTKRVNAILALVFRSMISSRTFEDRGIHTDALRPQICAQEDHMRLCGFDIFEYIEFFGFQGKVSEHGNLLDSIDSSKCRVNP